MHLEKEETAVGPMTFHLKRKGLVRMKKAIIYVISRGNIQ